MVDPHNGWFLLVERFLFQMDHWLRGTTMTSRAAAPMIIEWRHLWGVYRQLCCVSCMCCHCSGRNFFFPAALSQRPTQRSWMKSKCVNGFEMRLISCYFWLCIKIGWSNQFNRNIIRFYLSASHLLLISQTFPNNDPVTPEKLPFADRSFLAVRCPISIVHRFNLAGMKCVHTYRCIMFRNVGMCIFLYNLSKKEPPFLHFCHHKRKRPFFPWRLPFLGLQGHALHCKLDKSYP